MIYFAPAKINLGLQILERRGDGFHNLRSVMYPTGLCDIVEINQHTVDDVPIRYSQSGIRFDADMEKNLCIKAWKLMASEATLPNVTIHLHKQIPVGAGLGGGSSNATATLKGLNIITETPLPKEKLHEMASQLGSDCPFFFHVEPMMMEGRGEILSPVTLPLDQLHLVLLFTGLQIPTTEAYSGVKSFAHRIHLRELIRKPIDQWNELVVNDFEHSVFKRHPDLSQLKKSLYQAGALYASLSGSGSSLYGLFPVAPDLPAELERQVVWKGLAINPVRTI